ncbi:MAG TPA: cytoplasmic protein, partial [Chloroflexota bacterium]|nr:cytoplasmic protein [Chloroflexota bacterium]
MLENEQVRVRDYCDKPGDRTALHHYPSFVLYALSPFTRTLTLADGKRVTRTFQTGDVVWMEAQSHIVRTSG